MVATTAPFSGGFADQLKSYDLRVRQLGYALARQAGMPDTVLAPYVTLKEGLRYAVQQAGGLGRPRGRLRS